MSLQRWARQVAVPGFGPGAQGKIRESRVAVLGAGGIGCPAALYLAAAGIGGLVIVDCDSVEESNLNRQVLFTSEDIGRRKAPAAAERLKALDPGIDLRPMVIEVSGDNLDEILKGCSFVLDCLDRNASRLQVNRACLGLRIPAAHGFAQDMSCEVFTVLPGRSACLECAMDEGFPEDDRTPVVGISTGLAGVAMAAAAIRHIAGLGETIAGTRLVYDLAFSDLMKLPVERDRDCPACSVP